jgi:hypothetical protein
VYCFNHAAEIWWRGIENKLTRPQNLSVFRIPTGASQALAKLAQRSMQLQATLQEGVLMLGDGTNTVDTKGSSSPLLVHREVPKGIAAMVISRSSLRSTTSGLLGTYLHDTMPSQTFDWNLSQVWSKCVVIPPTRSLADAWIGLLIDTTRSIRHGVFVCPLVVGFAGHHPHRPGARWRQRDRDRAGCAQPSPTPAEKGHGLGHRGRIVVRSAMTIGVVWLLKIPGLMLVGGIALLWIAYKLIAERDGG